MILLDLPSSERLASSGLPVPSNEITDTGCHNCLFHTGSGGSELGSSRLCSQHYPDGATSTAKMSILSEVLLQLIERSVTPAQPLSTERAGESQTSPSRSRMKWHKSFTGSDLGCLTLRQGVFLSVLYA